MEKRQGRMVAAPCYPAVTSLRHGAVTLIGHTSGLCVCRRCPPATAGLPFSPLPAPMKTLHLKPLLLCLALALPTAVYADERESLETLRATTINLIKALVQQGVLTQDKADEILRQATANAAAVTFGAPAAASTDAGSADENKQSAKSVRVPYVPEFVKRDLKEQIKSELLAQAKNERWIEQTRLPDWLSRFTFSGDMTLRFEQDLFRPACPTGTTAGTDTTSCNVDAATYQANVAGSTINNTTVNRQLTRLRATEGAEIGINTHTNAEFRLSTGAAGNPVTNFQTLGSNFSRPTIGVDRASIRYEPVSWLRLQGGRFSNPFFGSDLLWYDRLGFDGAYASAMPQLTPSLGLFATLGAFPLQDLEPNPTTDVKSKWLYGSQLGGKWTLADKSSLKVGLGYYDFVHVEGVPNDNSGVSVLNSNSAPLTFQKGNTQFALNQLSGSASAPFGLASRFRELNLTTQADLASFDPVHVTLLVDVAKNLGFDANEINARTGGAALSAAAGTTVYGVQDPKYGGLLRPRVNAFGTRLTVGKPMIRERGDWLGYIGYKYVERDAVLDAFNDPDFHLGGTDAKGWLAGASIGLDHDTWLSVKYLSTQAIDGLPLSIDVMQLDFNVRF